ncbi:MAG: LLM class F420-dependent oxidoreductase [Deltaproteobacteria bacterium]|nr:LLM class F420-dependent oxidoreductase [Deltaproteobacteria bacterium]
MKLGVAIFPTDYSIRPDDFARACEERGFESVWFPEHTHIPVSRKTPYPAGGDLPKEYWHTHDPFVALMAAAAVTKTIKLATGICLLVERDPIVTAKQVASLDLLSNGRVLFGIGGGWNVEEMENHGQSFGKRWKLLRERVEAMKAIWTTDEAEYHGELVNFDKIWSFPKPLQKPHPPIILGSASKMGIKRVVDYCDGWIPIGLALPDLPKALAELRTQAQAKGRDPRSIEVSIFWAPPDADQLRHYRDVGVARAVLALPSVGRDQVLQMLDGMAGLVASVA